jgi:hypothetical protein
MAKETTAEGRRLAEYEKTAGRPAYGAIKDRLDLVLIYLEDGANKTAQAILKEFLCHK